MIKNNAELYAKLEELIADSPYKNKREAADDGVLAIGAFSYIHTNPDKLGMRLDTLTRIAQKFGVSVLEVLDVTMEDFNAYWQEKEERSKRTSQEINNEIHIVRELEETKAKLMELERKIKSIG